MQQTTYRFSERYIRTKVRGPIYGAITFSALLGLITVVMTLAGNWHPTISAGLFAAASIFMLLKNRKLSRTAAEYLPKVEVELSGDSLCFNGPAGREIIPISSITSIVVDQRAQEPRIVYLERAIGPTIQLEGFDKFDQLSRQLVKAIGSSKLKELQWWQFPPR